MIERKGIFDFLEKTFLIYGITITIFIVLTYLTGEKAKDISQLFQLGGKGISLITLLQLLAMSMVTVICRYLFFANALFKNMSIAKRTVGMFGTITVIMIVFILVFDWFQWNHWEAWITFFLTFGTCIICSYLTALLREKYENKKMSDALERLKKEK